DRHNGISFDSTVKLIRKRILEEKPVGISLYGGPVYSAYQLVYNNAVKTMPNDDGMMTEDGDVSDLALWAKNNAFVFLIGLDGDGKFMDTTEYAGITSFAKRNAFRDRAYHPYEYDATVNAFHHLKGDMPGKIKDLKIGSRSLMLWLTCYDLLKAAYALPELRDSLRNPFGFADADRNGLAFTPRNKLRKLTRDLYQESQGVRGVVTHHYGWKKNHGNAASAAILPFAQSEHIKLYFLTS
ncbi:MAG: hypothetical protein Q8R57_10465, partial [Bacteroidota bacterium]|nr:hypothetical protein [Bacteroidota bacterium]